MTVKYSCLIGLLMDMDEKDGTTDRALIKKNRQHKDAFGFLKS